jgi:hypothetical protein
MRPHYLSTKWDVAKLPTLRETVRKVKVRVGRVSASFAMDVERRAILSRNVQTGISGALMLQERRKMLMQMWLQLN